MKKAKFIKNELYKTLYRTSDNRYRTAVISFTSVRYEDKDREEFVTFNNIEEDDKKELWKEKLSKKISNYEDFINSNDIWKKEGTYVENIDKVKYMEPESLSENEFVLDSIDQVEIVNVTQKDANLAFIVIYDQNGDTYNMTCDFDNKDVILSKLISNYEKLCKKDRVTILNKEVADKDLTHVSNVTFIVSGEKVNAYIMHVDEIGKVHLENTTLEKGLNRIEGNSNIKVEYKAMIDGKCVAITEEEFRAMVSILPKTRKVVKTDDRDDIDTEINEDYIVDDRSKNRKIAIFTAVLALAGIGIGCFAFKSNKNDIALSKPNSSSHSDNSNGNVTTVTSQDDYIVTTIDNYINSNTNTTTISNSNVTTTTKTSTTTTNLTSSNSITNSTNNTTTNNGYVTTNVPTTKYTGTYQTVNPKDTAISGQTTKTTTKSTAQNIIPSGTVNKSDMVTAGTKPGDQVFTKDGATTTTKTSTTTKSTTSYNKYADLIITGDINAAKPETNKSLVLKK